MSDSVPTALIFDTRSRQWQRFTGRIGRLRTTRPSEVLTTLQAAVDAVHAHACHAVGYLSYEAGAGLDPRLRTRTPDELPLVWFDLFQHVESVGPDLPYMPLEAGVSPVIDWTPSIEQSDYELGIHRIREYLAAGDTYQTNFTFRLHAESRIAPWPLFLHMIARQGNGVGAFLNLDRWSVASASPELFFRLDGNHIVTIPMKGTAPRGHWSEQDQRQGEALARDPKNRAENLMIVDMARNDLGRIADIGTVHTSKLFTIERYPTLWQMTSTVEARTSSGIPEIFQALFPAASITGAPKLRTCELIAELETTPRNIYTGSIGWIAPGRKAQFNVAIRTLLFDHQRQTMEYGVGGGIVIDSTPAHEFEECRTKAEILRPAPPEFMLLESLRWTPIERYSRLHLHLARLQASADYFQFAIDPEAINQYLRALENGLPLKPHKIRITLQKDGTFHAEATELTPLPHPLRARLAAHPIDPGNPFLYHKTTLRRTYETALAEADGADEALLFNPDGEWTEFTIGNLFLQIDRTLYTPPLRCGLLPGRLRMELLQAGKAEERVLTLNDLAHASALFLGNSVRGLLPVTLLDPP